MRTILAAAVSLAAAGAAAAADFPINSYYTAPAALSVAGSWAGPYLGANIGYELATVDNNPTKPSGIAGGIQAGYNLQRGQFVFGGETDFQLSGADATVAPWQFSNPWFGTVRGRAGVAFSNVLSTAPPASPTGICGSTLRASRSRTRASAGPPAPASRSASRRAGPRRRNGSISI
jgi:outer membrane immunogenic protein